MCDGEGIAGVELAVLFLIKIEESGCSLKDTEIVTLKKIGNNIVEVQEDFILIEEPLSRLVFQAQIHKNGIRGKIVRQRRESKNDYWVPEKSIDIRTLGKNESINIELRTAAVENLYLAIAKLANVLHQEGIRYGENTYKIVDNDSLIISDKNLAVYIRKLMEAGYDEEVWNNLAESNPTLVSKLSYARVQNEKRKVITELEGRLLKGTFSETTGPDSWQKWIYKNNWLFGVNYRKPIEKTKININGIMPDFLFPTIDGFVDILEIKLPTDQVIVEDSSHRGSWKWTPDCNIAIGQVVNYLCEIDRLRLEIERTIKIVYGTDICLLKPRAYILIGDNKVWTSEKKEGLRKLNYALHGIEIVTYRELIERGRNTISTQNYPA